MTLRRIVASVLSLLLAAFFGFVGWHKSVDSLADLARYGAWTTHLPEWPGRIVGWSEIACAAALLIGLVLPRWGRFAGLVLIANQIVATLVHARAGETAALPQNVVLIVMLIAVTWAHQKCVPKGEL